ncbi:MAG: hypothetical protein WD768_18665 [Phycisphaeraceae bacterium]
MELSLNGNVFDVTEKLVVESDSRLNVQSATQLSIAGGTVTAPVLDVTGVPGFLGDAVVRLQNPAADLRVLQDLTLEGGTLRVFDGTVMVGNVDSRPANDSMVIGPGGRVVLRGVENGPAGRIDLNAASLAAPGALAIQAGGELHADRGWVFGHVENEGRIVVEGPMEGSTVPGLQIVGSFNQTAFGDLAVTLRSTSGPTVHVETLPGATSSLGGTLNVVTTGMMPEAGDRFTLLRFTPESQAFSGRFHVSEGVHETLAGSDVFLGLDYKPAVTGALRDDGTYVNAIALTVPKKADGTPLSADTAKKNLILVTHGTTSLMNFENSETKSGMIVDEKITSVAFRMNDFIQNFNSLRINPSDHLDWEVAVFDWREFSTTLNPANGDKTYDPFESARVGQQIGYSLAEWMSSNGLDNYNSIHLLSHSSGSWLIEGLGDRLIELNGASAPELHLTFFDTFYPPAHTFTDLGELGELIASKPNNTLEQYVDRAIWGTQETLVHAINFDVTGLRGVTLNPLSAHAWPYDWYAETISHLSTPRTGDGCNGSPDCVSSLWGFVRSPLYRDFMALTGAAQSGSEPWVAGKRYVFIPTGGAGALMVIGDVIYRTDDDLVSLVFNASGSVQLQDGSFILTTQSPAILDLEIDFTDSVNFMNFTGEFLSDAQGVLSVFVEGELVGLISEELAFGPLDSGDLFLGKDYLPGTYTVRFHLEREGDIASSFRLDSLRFGFAQTEVVDLAAEPVPEPGMAMLLLVSCAALSRRRCRLSAAD